MKVTERSFGSAGNTQEKKTLEKTPL